MNAVKNNTIRDLYFAVAKLDIYSLAREQGWDDVKRFGHGGLVEKTVEVKGWLVMPVGDYKENIPQEAIMRAKTVKERIRIRGFLIADDKRHRRYQPKKGAERDRLLLIGATAAGLMGTVLFGMFVFAAALPGAAAAVSTPVVTAGVAVTGATASASVVIPLLAAAVVMDPVLICVTMEDEDEWIALYRWDD